MRTRPAPFLLGLTLAAAAAALAPPRPASAHPVTVDGSSAEWFQHLPSAPNVGMIARDSTGAGEYIWRDALGDTRTDLATPEVVADIASFQVTGDATGIGFLLRRAVGPNYSTPPPIQVQIAIDVDRADGSGQEFFAEFGDTKVANGARWERLVQTLFGTGGTAKVIDTSFNEVAVVPAMTSPAGVNIEMFVPWTALGLNGPPTAPLRFTVATFRTKTNSDVTTDIGGPNVSNALDAITDYGDPAAANHPNTYQDVEDLIVDYSFDLHFNAAGEVYAPLVIQRYLPNASVNPDEWYTVKNVSTTTLPLGGFKLGDEETPDGTEGMFSFPAAATLAPGATYTVARAGAAYSTFYGVAPDAEMPPSASPVVPDMVIFPAWTTAGSPTMQLTNAGDELLVLDPSNTILDVVTYGTGAYAGVTAFTPAPGANQVLTRDGASSDTDNCLVDFSNAGATCTTDAQCGSPCKQCSNNTCENKAMGATCADANPCDGDEICNGMGACVTNPAPACDDGDPCTTDTCAPGTGCAHALVAPGTSCSDGDACNGAEVCDAAGTCLSGAPLACDDMDPCTVDACDPVTGCSNADAPAGSECSDGNPCNGTETCDAAGACVPGAPPDCDDQNPCTADSCDPAGGCSHVDVADGTGCSDGDACNGDESCVAGQCAAGEALVCDDQNPCTADSCDPASGCKITNEPAGTACDAGDACAGFDACDGQGQCVAGEGGCGGEGGQGGQGGQGGSGGSTGTTTSSTTTSGGEGGSGGSGGDGIDDGGCGCRAAGSDDRAPGSLAWLAGLAVAAGLARRRRRG